MSHSSNERTGQRIRRPTSASEAISAVKISEGLTAEIDLWAETHGMTRSDAIRRLIEIGLSSPTSDKIVSAPPGNPSELANLAIMQIEQLLDPSLLPEERERRIHRLVEGPPEFSAERIDLPRPRG